MKKVTLFTMAMIFATASFASVCNNATKGRLLDSSADSVKVQSSTSTSGKSTKGIK